MKINQNENLEILAKRIQRDLNDNPVLLLGSGASIPYGLPSMDDLSKELIDKLDGEFCSNEGWKNFVEEIKENGNLETALARANFDENIHNKIIYTTWTYFDLLDRKAIAKFLQTGESPSITSIIKKFVEKSGPTQIVTTNYDRLIEFAIDSARAYCETGFLGNCIKTFGFPACNQKSRIVNLYKVHGSVNWFKHLRNHTLIATDFFNPNILSDIFFPMIVTPGNEKYKETHNDPFRTVMTESDKALRNSSSYLCIGYGFNDEHIQPIIIEENRTKNKPVIIVTKSITPKIKELFIESDCCYYTIISENNSEGGTHVSYSKTETEVFSENYWNLDNFYKLWFD